MSKTTKSQTDNTEPTIPDELDEILGNLLSLGEMYSLQDLDSAKQELTKLISKREIEARIDENVRSNSRLLSIQKGFMTLQEALDESFETLTQLKEQTNE